MLNLCGIVATILKMATARNFSMSGINSGHHNLPIYEMSLKSDNVEFVRIVVAILKMVTARNFSMSGIYPGHHNLHTYEISLKWDNVEFVRYCGGHF
jgi:5-carboxymethyl-2-hydroxymuconate isomerase